MLFPLIARKKKQQNKINLQDEQKKDKVSLMQRLLTKNKIMSILSHQPKKLMKLAKKGNTSYKNLQQVNLLPKLTLKQLFPQIEQLTKKNQKIRSQFEYVNEQLTCSMINLQHKFTLISQQEQGKILDLQTKKCYKNIPQIFFHELSPTWIETILMKNKVQASEQSFLMIDYNDQVNIHNNIQTQVEYNISQQVNYKIKLFMDFATFLKGVADLVDIACKKSKATRSKNTIIREIIIKRSINIHILRTKQQNLLKTIQIMQQINIFTRKIKHMQKSLMSIIHAKGKMGVGQFYEVYCNQHEKVKQLCCKQHLCNFGDLRYYVQRNYHQTFNKSMQNYIGELSKIEKKKFIDILKPIKANYLSTPFETRNDKQEVSLVETIEIEEEFELVIKNNIQKEIVKIFQFGLEKCTYSTDNLCVYIKQQLQEIQLNVYSAILENSDKPKEDIFDNFVSFALNKPTQDSLKYNISHKNLNLNQKYELINKLTIVKFLQISQLLSKKIMQLNVRCFSIVNELLKILRQLQRNQPQKEQIISSYLMELVMIVIGFANTCFGSFIQLKQVKQTQIKITDKFIKLCQEWENFIEQAQTKYQFIWRKLIFILSDHPKILKTNKSISIKVKKSTSFQELEEFVQENYNSNKKFSSLSNDSQDLSQQLICKEQMKGKIINRIIRTKNDKINFNFYALSKITIGKQLTKRIQIQNWTLISMNSNLENSIGFILYGQEYIVRQDTLKNSHNYLSRSLLLEKSNLGVKKISEELTPPHEHIQTQQQKQIFQIQTTESLIRIKGKSFRLIGVSEYILEVIHFNQNFQVLYHFFIYFDMYFFHDVYALSTKESKQNIPQKSNDYPEIKSNQLLSKAIELVMILAQKIKHYVNNLKDLQKIVKSFAKFILIVYSQLQFFKNLILELFLRKERFQKDKKYVQKNTEKQNNEMKKNFIKDLDQIINQVVKKYNSISYDKIKESIKKMEINPRQQINIPSQTTQEILAYFSKSLSLVQSIVIGKNLFYKFMSIAWIKPYLQKVNEQSIYLRKFVMKSNGSGAGKIEQISWETKLEWKQKQLSYLLMQIEAQNYSEHIKDLNIIQNQLRKQKQKNRSN